MADCCVGPPSPGAQFTVARRSTAGISWGSRRNTDRFLGAACQSVNVVRSGAEAGVAAETARVHTPTVTPKNLLALIGTIWTTALLLSSLVLTFLNVPAKRATLPPDIKLFGFRNTRKHACGC
jgi:hypothetical protein